MAAYAVAMPILPDRTEAMRRFSAELLGPRQGEHSEFLRRIGMTCHLVWLQQTPQGDVAILYWEGGEPAPVFQALALLDSPYARWFRGQLKDLYGMDFTQPGPAPSVEPLFEWRGA